MRKIILALLILTVWFSNAYAEELCLGIQGVPSGSICANIRLNVVYSNQHKIYIGDKVASMPTIARMGIHATEFRVSTASPFLTRFLQGMAADIWAEELSNAELLVGQGTPIYTTPATVQVSPATVDVKYIVDLTQALSNSFAGVLDANTENTKKIPVTLILENGRLKLPSIVVKISNAQKPDILFPDSIPSGHIFPILVDGGVIQAATIEEQCNGEMPSYARIINRGSWAIGILPPCNIRPGRIPTINIGPIPNSKTYSTELRSLKLQASVYVSDRWGHMYTYRKAYEKTISAKVQLDNVYVKINRNEQLVTGKIYVTAPVHTTYWTNCTGLKIRELQRKQTTMYSIYGPAQNCNIAITAKSNGQNYVLAYIKVPSATSVTSEIRRMVDQKLPSGNWVLNVTARLERVDPHIQLARLYGSNRITSTACVRSGYNDNQIVKLWKTGYFPVKLADTGACVLYAYVPVRLIVPRQMFSAITINRENGGYVATAAGSEIYRSASAASVIQYAIDHVSNGGTIHIGPGKYTLTASTLQVIRGVISDKNCWIYSSIQIYGKKHIKIIGSGVDRTILQLAPNINVGLGPKDAQNTYAMIYAREYNGITIEDLTLDGDGQNQQMTYHDGMALLLTGGHRAQLMLDNLKIENSAWDGIYLGYNSNGWEKRSSVNRVTFSDIRHDALVLDRAESVTVNYVKIYGSPRFAIYLEGAPPGVSGNITIAHTYIQNGIIYHTVLNNVTIADSEIYWSGNKPGYGAITTGNAGNGSLNIINTKIHANTYGILAYTNVRLEVRNSSIYGQSGGVLVFGNCENPTHVQVLNSTIQGNPGVYGRGTITTIYSTEIFGSPKVIQGPCAEIIVVP